MKALRFALCICLVLAVHMAFAQLDTNIIIIKPYEGTIADAYKIKDMPVVKDSVPPAPKLSYGINSKKVNTPFTVTTLNSAKMGGEPLSKLYNSLVKIGGGNYSTPYLEAFYNNLRSKEYSFGTHLKHLSSNADYDGYGFGGFSDNEVGVYGKKFMHKHTLFGNLDYDRDVGHYYGYDTSAIHIMDEKAEITKQRYAWIGTNLGYQSHYTDSVHLNYLLGLKYYNLTDFYNTSENHIGASSDFSGYYEKQLFHAPVAFEYYNNRDTLDTTNTVIFGLNPYMLSGGDKWNTRLGAGITIEGNQHTKSRFLFSYNIDFNYNVLENIIVPYAGVDGGFKKNTLKSLTDENPFLIPAPQIKNTNTNFEVYFGVKGSITKNVSYNTRGSFSSIQDMYFFVNEDRDFFKKGFDVVYDDVNLWNAHGEVQFQSEEKIKVILKGDLNGYDMQKELKPWHKPLWQTTLTANYNLKNKIIVSADLFLIGDRNARILEDNGFVFIAAAKQIKPVVDANLGVEYRYSKKLSAFVNFNNLGFKRYYLWNNYPTQKFNFLAGITMVF